MNWRTHDAIAEIHHLASRPRDYHWVLEADIAACFDEIGHVPLLDRVRARIKDKRVVALVRAFLKAGILTKFGDRRRHQPGTRKAGHYPRCWRTLPCRCWTKQQWQELMGTQNQRTRRRKNGLGAWRLIRYCDDFVVMVHGERRHAEVLREEVADVLATLGLRLSLEKTRVVHIDEGFDFLGHNIRRQRKRRNVQVLRLHQTVQESRPGHQGQGRGQDVQVIPVGVGSVNPVFLVVDLSLLVLRRLWARRNRRRGQGAPVGRPRQRPQVLDAVAGRRTLFEAEDRGCRVLLLGPGWGSCAAPGPGSRLVDMPPGGGCRSSLRRARGGMVRCDRFAVDEINQTGRSRRAGSGIMTATIRVHHEVQRPAHAAVRGSVGAGSGGGDPVARRTPA